MKKFIITLLFVSSLSTFVKAEVNVKSNPIGAPIIKNSISKSEGSIPKNIKKDFEKDDGYALEGFQFGVGVGILGGANAQLGYRIPQRSSNFWKNRFGFRLDYNTWKPLESIIEDEEFEIDDNKFKPVIEGTNFGALIDIYPFGNTWGLGNFRLSAGYYTGDFSLGAALNKEANESFYMYNEDTDQEYRYVVNGNAVLSANLEADVKGPYAGVGFDFALLWGLKMYFDAGLVFIDDPVLTSDINGDATVAIYDENGNTVASGINVNVKDNPYIENLLNDTVAQYEDELKDVVKGYFPMIKLGFLYRF